MRSLHPNALTTHIGMIVPPDIAQVRSGSKNSLSTVFQEVNGKTNDAATTYINVRNLVE
jgi:hypothetical protein